MTVKKKWTVIPGFIALAAAATLLSAYSGASSSQGRVIQQPIKFVHAPHIQKAGMNCLYCHNTANNAPDPGIPAVSTCLGCHEALVVPGKPEIVKLKDYAKKGLPVPWNRVHKVPDYVQFPHMRHVNAGVTCQTCHGDIQNQGPAPDSANFKPVVQANSLNMGWCVKCHVEGYRPAEGARLAGQTVTPQLEAMPAKKARYDCSSCHY